METAALVTWLMTAGGGFAMLGIWISQGGLRPDGPPSRLPRPVLFGHFLLAAVGLLVWIGYLVADENALAWVAFVLLLPVAALGFLMFFKWLGGRNAAATPADGDGATPAAATEPEQKFPVPVVLVHGLVGAVTLVLVLLTAIDGSS